MWPIGNLIHEITRNETTRSNTNNISREFVCLIRVVSWIGFISRNSC
jgi:hypothetical protein